MPDTPSVPASSKNPSLSAVSRGINWLNVLIGIAVGALLFGGGATVLGLVGLLQKSN